MINKVKFELNESKKYKLRSLIISKFGKKFIDQDSEYITTENDLIILYNCINEFVFNNKLPKNPILNLVDRTNEMAKGLFLFSLKNKNIVPKIKIFREKNRDTPLFIASALCHEMIHYFDFLYGPLSKINDATFKNENGKQFVGEYDSHGDYFQRYMNIAIQGGIPVQISHTDKIKVRYFMFGKEIIDEKEKQELPSLAEKAKMFYNAIKTDDLFIVQVKDDEVYVAMQ
jgi:hypothetical protein